jgi:S-adenosylmethionine:tRNA ribosyltransferase-isomerase
VNLSEFDYHLPPELIAQEPLADRAASRMLVLHRSEGQLEDRAFRDLPQYLRTGDCLVVNDTKVFPSRLLGHRAGHEGAIEIFLLRPLTGDRREWEALGRPGRKLMPGQRLVFGPLEAEITGKGERGLRRVRFLTEGDIDALLEHVGHVPLPPYIHRGDRPEDRERYQTVFARERGSVAAPTAGLHFTPEVMDACRARGADLARVTLHVGLGTFEPLASDIVEEAHLHSERFAIGADAAAQVNRARRRIAVGTTSVRTLESAALRAVPVEACEGDTALFIYPGFRFQVVDAMLTNFHLPKSSLLLLVSAFAGREFALAAYEHAVRERYRFFSYGDCMLIL